MRIAWERDRRPGQHPHWSCLFSLLACQGWPSEPRTLRDPPADVKGNTAARHRGIPGNVPTATASPRRSHWFLAVVATASVALLWFGVSCFAAWRLTRRPVPRFDEPPSALGTLPVEPVSLLTADGEHLGAWLIRGDPARPIVVALHGHGASRSSLTSYIAMLTGRGLGVMAPSLRAHGDSTGSRTDLGWSDRDDVVAAVQHVLKLWPRRPIVVLGRSMGAAAAVFASRELAHTVRGYVLEAPYESLDVAMQLRVTHTLPAPFALVASSGLSLWAPLFLPVSPGEISPRERIADIPADLPVMLITGALDWRAPSEGVRSIQRHAGAHARVVVLPHADHNDALSADRELYERALLDFIDAVSAANAP